MDKLKPCPFCGGKAKVVIQDRKDWREYYQTAFIRCKDCWCRTGNFETSDGYEKEMADVWNRRVNNDLALSNA